MKKKQQALACAVSAALALTALGLPATAYANTEPVINASTETVRQSWESVYGESIGIQIVDGVPSHGAYREDGNLWVHLGNADPTADLLVAEEGAGHVVMEESGDVYLVIAPDSHGYAGLRLVFRTEESGSISKWAIGWMITRITNPPAPEPAPEPETPAVTPPPAVQPPVKDDDISGSRVEKKTVHLTANAKLAVTKKTASKVTLRATVSGAKGYVQTYDSKAKTWKTVRTVKAGTSNITLKRTTTHRYYRVVSQAKNERKVVIRNSKNFSVTYVTDYITAAKTSGKVVVKGMPKVTIKKSGKSVKVKSTHAGTVKVTGHKLKKIKANRTYTFKLKSKKNSVVVKIKSNKTTDALTVKRTVKR